MNDISTKISVFDINFDNLTIEQVLKRIDLVIEKKAKIYIVTPYSEIIMMARKNREYRSVINSADLVLPDGMGVMVAAKFLGMPLKERLTGVDLTAKIIERSAKMGYKLFLLGSTEKVLVKLSENWRSRYRSLKFMTYSPPFRDVFTERENRVMIDRVNEFRPNILFVAFGSPKGEEWIATHLNHLHVNAAIGVGGTFDFLTGDKRRAPRIIQKLCLEWLYRLVREPKRIKRQIVVPIFILRILLLLLWGKGKN